MNTARKFLKGNEAVVYGALAAGCRCYFGYPITPQNDIPELMSSEMVKAGGQFVQAESEVAAANMLLGAAACGVRAFTSSSSPGVSLMQEAISYMAGSELPGVIVNMVRGGPGLGDIGSSQGDYFQAVKGGGHGDYRCFVLAPATCQEAYDHMIEAFDVAFQWRVPVMVLGDAILGQMKEPVTPWTPDVNADLGKDWRLEGAGDRPERLLKSLFLDDGALAGHNIKLQERYKAMQPLARLETVDVDDADLVIVAFGTIGRIARSAAAQLRKQGHKVGVARPVTLYPFPIAQLQALVKPGRRFLTIEQNCGQMVEDVRLALAGKAEVAFHGHMPGNLPNPDDFLQPILDALAAKA